MAINKVIVNGETKLDLTADTATADKVLEGFTFHDATGELKTGTNSDSGGIDGYYIKKVFNSSDISNLDHSVHVDITTEGKYSFFHVGENSYDYGSPEMIGWHSDYPCSGISGTLYVISTQPITYLNYYENSSSSSSY